MTEQSAHAAREAPVESGGPPDRVDQLTADLQRLGAEYANYRKRAERDRDNAATQARASLVTALLPALDNLDRAEQHDQLSGPLHAVADTLHSALSEIELAPFGSEGDRFDPHIHEATEYERRTGVAITEPTVTCVHRRGYRLGQQLLRPALVAVTEPETTAQPENTAQPETTAQPENTEKRGQ